jgi:hypothetical protein
MIHTMLVVYQSPQDDFAIMRLEIQIASPPHTPYVGMYNCYHVQHISINYSPTPLNKNEIVGQFKVTHYLRYNHLARSLLLTNQKQLILFTSPFGRHYILGTFQTQSKFHIYLTIICHPKYSE